MLFSFIPDTFEGFDTKILEVSEVVEKLSTYSHDSVHTVNSLINLNLFIVMSPHY